MFSRKIHGVAVLVSIAIGLSACGGSDDSTEASPVDAALATEVQETPLCTEVQSLEDLPEDGECRERPTCLEVEEGSTLPEGEVCLDLPVRFEGVE